MENRFGIKDLVLIALLVVLIVMIGLAMKQYDRQWQIVQEIQEQSNSQLHELIGIERLLQSGASVGRAPTTQGGVAENQGVDPFFRIKQIEARPDFARGDWLVDNFGTRVGKLTPLVSSDVYSSIVQNRIQESLTYRDAYTLEAIPLLATSWTETKNFAAWQAYIDKRIAEPISEADIVKESDCPPADQTEKRKAYIADRLKQGRRQNDIVHEPDCPPALTITFQLRQGVQFSDGQPFTADDVVFSYDFVMDPKIDAPRARAFLDEIKGVVKQGDYQVAVNFREPYYESLDLASLQIMPKHFYSKFTPDQFNNSVGLLMGTGPYMLADPEKWTPSNEKIELVRNDRYWGEPGPFDRLEYLQVQGEAVGLTMFQNGDVDLFAALPEQYKALLNDKAILARTQHFEYSSPLRGYSYVAWNEMRDGKATVFADKRVRQALTMLIDRQRICDEVYLGYAQPACGPFSSISKQHDPSNKPWPYDVDKAKSILKDLGFSDRDGSGVISNTAGQRLQFKLTYPSKEETYERIVLLMKDNLAKAGIALEPDPTDWPILIQKLDQRNFDAISLAWSGSLEDDIYQMFHSSQIKDAGDDMMSYANSQLDQLIEKARHEVDEDKRMPLWWQCEKILHDDQPYTFLTESKSLVFFDKRIHNVEPSKIGLNYAGLFVMPVPWYVPAGQRKWSK